MKEYIPWIIGAVITTGSVVVAITKISNFLKGKGDAFRNWLNEPTKKELLHLKKEFQDKDYRDCQKDLLDFLTDVDNGEYKTEVQIQHMCNMFKHYTKNLNGNTYIEKEWHRIMEKGERRVK